MKMRNRLGIGVALCTLVQPSQVLAQESNDTPDDEELQMEVIVVQATRRNSALEDIAGSLNVVSGEDVGAGGIQNSSDLSFEVPNLSIGDQFGVNRAFIRGIGFNSIDLGADGAVAFLQNGSVITRPAAQLSGFYDLEQLEVLRGPQGTLYGRGATGGVVNMVTARPTEDLEGYARFTYGNFDAVTLEGAISGPISEKVMFRLAGEYENRDGYGTNLATGNPVDDRDAYALRGSLLFDASEELEFLLIGDYFREDDFNYAFHDFGPSIVPREALPGPVFGGSTIFDLTDDPETRDINSDQDAINDREGWGLQAIATWSRDEWRVVSTTAYKQFERFNRDDLDVTEVDAFGQNNYTEDSQAFSQDLTINYEQDNWSILAGATYLNESLDGQVLVRVNNIGEILFGAPPGAIPDGIFLQDGSVTTDAFGIFLEGTLEIAPDFRVTAGGRYNYEKRDGVGNFTFTLFGTDVSTDQAESWGAFTPKLLLEYDVSDDLLLYASVTRGFKSGVINVGSVNPVIDPEFIWSYEAGFKVQDRENGFTMSGAGFYYDYSDLQVGFVNSANIVETINAASARIWGVELDASLAVTDALSLRGFVTYLNAEFTDFCTGYYAAGNASRRQFPACPTDPSIVDLTGNRLPNAPEFTAAVFADYYVDLGDSGQLDFSVDVNYQDDVFFTEFNNQDAVQDGFVNVNARITYAPASESWSLSVWGRNLTDEYVQANNIVTAPLYGFVRVGSLRPPRTYGISFNKNF